MGYWIKKCNPAHDIRAVFLCFSPLRIRRIRAEHLLGNDAMGMNLGVWITASLMPECRSNHIRGRHPRPAACFGIVNARLKEVFLNIIEGVPHSLIRGFQNSLIPTTRVARLTDLGAESVKSKPGRCWCSPSRTRPRRISLSGTWPSRT